MAEPVPAFELPLGRLADRFGLSLYQTGQLGRFAAILAHDENAPTTVRKPKLVRDDHLADALVALELPVIRQALTIADLGAGAGVPGIPLAVALPQAQVYLVEGNGRKCEFMAHVAVLLELGNAEVVHGRAETWKQGLGRFDAVTARALAPLDVIAEYAAPLLRVGGAMVAWRGKREPQVEADAVRAAELLGLSVAEPVQVQPYKGAEHRYLHVMSKVRETPERFPRRDGVARKRPLGRR
jgi:16S rRNA (guanine527-N7)-methyltransferase